MAYIVDAMIFMPQFFDVIANENARYKSNELECDLAKANKGPKGPHIVHLSTTCNLSWRIG